MFVPVGESDTELRSPLTVAGAWADKELDRTQSKAWGVVTVEVARLLLVLSPTACAHHYLAMMAQLPHSCISVSPTNHRQLSGSTDSVSFAMHDGNGNWDNNGTKNYIVSKAGTYRLSDGELTPLPSSLPVLVVCPRPSDDPRPFACPSPSRPTHP